MSNDTRRHSPMLGGVTRFALDTTSDDLPDHALEGATRYLRDLVATAASGSCTDMAAISRAAAAQTGPRPDGARVLFGGHDGVDPALAAFAGAATIDSFDAHDGHVLTKGHTGVAVLPAALVAIDRQRSPVSGRAFLATLVVGYEIGIRAGIASHRTAADYFTSGSWNCLAAAAAAARHSEIDHDRLGHAFGIAEFSSPRGLMMRCIDEPTMVKDGSCWGAQIGVQSVDLAHAHPASTEEAQYSLPFPVAAMLVHGDLGPTRIGPAGLADPTVLALAAKIDLVEDPTANARFPQERWASVRIDLADGRSIASPSMRARGDADEPLTAAELDIKWDELVPPVLGADDAARLRTAIDDIAQLDDIGPLLELLYRAPLPR